MIIEPLCLFAVVFGGCWLSYFYWLVSSAFAFGFGSVWFVMDKGKTEIYDPKSGHVVNSTTCSCPACRAKFNLRRKEEREKLKKEKKAKRLDRRFGVLQDILLFCRVFPEGIAGDCDFWFNGFCLVFEDGCVRWNELGDKMDYSVGKTNPFEGGE